MGSKAASGAVVDNTATLHVNAGHRAFGIVLTRADSGSACVAEDEGPSYDDEVARMVEERDQAQVAKVEAAFQMFNQLPMGELFSTYKANSRSRRGQDPEAAGGGQQESSTGAPTSSTSSASANASTRATPSQDTKDSPHENFAAGERFRASLKNSLKSSVKSDINSECSADGDDGDDDGLGESSCLDLLSHMLPGSSFADDTPHLSFSSPSSANKEHNSSPPSAALPRLDEEASHNHGIIHNDESPLCAAVLKSNDAAKGGGQKGSNEDNVRGSAPSFDVNFAHSAMAGSLDTKMRRMSSEACDGSMSMNGYPDSRGASIGGTKSQGEGSLVAATWEYDEVTEDGGVALNFEALMGSRNLQRLHEVMDMQCDEDDEDDKDEADEADDVYAKVTGDSDRTSSHHSRPTLVSGSGDIPAIRISPSRLHAAVNAAASLITHLPAAAMEVVTNVITDPFGSKPLPPIHGAEQPTASAATEELPKRPSPLTHLPIPKLPATAKGQQGSALCDLPPIGLATLAQRMPSIKCTAAASSAHNSPPPSARASKAADPRQKEQQAELMKSKKEDLAAAIREQLKARLNATANEAPISGVSLGPVIGRSSKSFSHHQDSHLPPSSFTPPNAARPSVRPTPPNMARPNAARPGARPTPLKDGMSPEAAALEVLKAHTKKEELERSIKVGFIEGKIKPINIVMLITGTRGDVQPFIGIGLKLKEYGHRVRIASHKIYRPFVEGFGLEFYPLGGDPKVLSEYVVKHRGIMPGLDIKDALKQRGQVKEILYSSWGACVNPDPENAHKPFIADAIVANPPAYGHSHCAEKLNCPLHIVFTMPWTPTKAFPSPFARIKTIISENNSMAREAMNWLSYFAMEDLAWLGMAGMVKDFRQRVLGIKTWTKQHTSHALYHSKVPVTYIWSPTLVSRPKDWPSYCEVVGFINLEVNKLTKYKPPAELADFLAAGPPPVYIGFGSLVVSNPAKMTQQFLHALKVTGLRAIIQKGWGGLGAGVEEPPEGVFLLDGNCAHDWLFEQCSAVVHHGGAGTTATGLYAGKPTFIVYFFGDQPFWGAACHRAGVGPAPVGIDDLTTPKIIDGLKDLIMPSCLSAAKIIGALMHKEDGISATVDHMHRTIYGALVGGRSHIWMTKNDAHKRHVIKTKIAEDRTGGDEGHLRGMLAMPSNMNSAAPPTSRTLPAAAPGSLINSFQLPAVGEAFSTGSICSGFGKTAPVPPAGRAAASAPVVDSSQMKRKGGFFSLLGC